jgi:NitT/TauT family transport system substrate-binding protein
VVNAEKEKAIKILIALAVVLAAICVLTTTAQMCEAREIKELHIGYQPITHQIAEMTAMEKGWWKRDLERFGIEKVTDTEFPSGPPEMTAMMAGELDVAYVGISRGLERTENSYFPSRLHSGYHTQEMAER